METALIIALAGALLIAVAGLGALLARERGRVRSLEDRLAAARREEADRLRSQPANPAGTADSDAAVVAELIHLIDLAGGSALAVQAGRALAAAGVEEASPLPGDPFDPERHAAVGAEPSDGLEPGTILRLERPGWIRRGTLIRTADVTVAVRADAEGVWP